VAFEDKTFDRALKLARPASSFFLTQAAYSASLVITGTSCILSLKLLLTPEFFAADEGDELDSPPLAGVIKIVKTRDANLSLIAIFFITACVREIFGL
jgi:hypothetical protein